MASVPYVRRQREVTALGGQQAQRLQQLRLASEKHVQDQHLQLSLSVERSLQPPGERDEQLKSPVFPHSSRASRTVEAVIESRAVPPLVGSKATRMRTTIRDARGGSQTERSADERTQTMAPVGRLPVATSRPATYATAPPKTHGIRQKIAAVRRRYPTAAAMPRKLTRDELEWIEKQIQFTQRVALLEKECSGWWQTYYSSAGIVAGVASGADAAMTALAIQKQLEDCHDRRCKDTQDMVQQLNALRSNADGVSQMVLAMRDGTQFVGKLQEAMDAFESALSVFRITQREKFDAYVLEEKLLERDLATFTQKIEAWELEDAEKKQSKQKGKRNGASVKCGAISSSSPVECVGMESCTKQECGDETAGHCEQTGTNGDGDLVKRVRQLNDQIMRSGGLKGGWDDREHAVFAATLLKFGLTDDVIVANQLDRYRSNQEDKMNSVDFESTVAKFLRKCITAVVTKSDNAVRNHFEWYVGHLLLVHEKKEVIQQWKQQKEAERRQLVRQGLHQVELEQENERKLQPEESGGKEITDEDRTRRKERETEDRARKTRQLEAWREEKERKAAEKIEQENHIKVRTEARDAKKRQELLEKKQQIMLYKLQKEEEYSALQQNRVSDVLDSRPPKDEVLLERSRKAIEKAKAKRAQLQAMEEQRLKQQRLPERPKSVTKRIASKLGPGAGSPTDSEGSGERTLLKPTKAYEARQLSKLELKRKEKERSSQGAHDTYFPGANVVSDVKLKSFGHIPIAPRAVPTWRRNI